MSKPKFDPNKPYDAASEKPPFDPNKSFETAGPDGERQKYSKLESFGMGAREGAALGFADELEGGAKALYHLTTNPTTNLSNVGDAYRSFRDAARNKYTQAREDNPYSYGTGNVAGGVASSVLPGMGLLKGAKGAAAIGAVAGLGGSNADLTKGEVGRATFDTALGGGLGYGVGKVADVLINPGEYADSLALKHLRPTPALRRELGKEGALDVAREARNAGAIKFATKAEDTALRLADAKDAVGEALGDIVGNANGKVDTQKVVDNITKKVSNPLRETAENQPIADMVEKKAAGLLKKYGGTMTPAQIEAEKSAVQKNINYLSTKTEMGARKAYGSALREAGEQAISDPNFVRTKEAYGNLKNALKMADRTGSLTDGGGLMGHITDVGIGTEAARELSHGNPIGLALGAARAATKGRLASAGSATLTALENLYKQNPALARKVVSDLAKRAQLNALPEYTSTQPITSQGLGLIQRGLKRVAGISNDDEDLAYR